MDRRVSLYDVGIKKIELAENKVAVLKCYEEGEECWLRRGGTCLAYQAYIYNKKDAPEKHKFGDGGRRVILKEFFPVLQDTEAVNIVRNSNGEVNIPEVAYNNSKEFKKKLERFENSERLFKDFGSEDVTNNFIVKSLGKFKANGTVYIIMDYDNAESMDEFMLSNPSIHDFFVVLKKAAEAVKSFHLLGYLHLDVTPSNLLYFDAHTYVNVMDTDSIVKREDVDSYTLSYSPGYTAPEVKQGKTNILKKYGERADVFSIGAITYRFLMNKRLECFTDDEEVDEKLLGLFEYEKELADKIGTKYDKCSRYAIDLIKDFLRNTITDSIPRRYKDMDEVIEAIEKITKYVNEDELVIKDNFSPNNDTIFGRDRKLREIEEKLGKQEAKSKSRIVCITGIGGIGKSSLARLYAEKHQNEYTSIVEIHASSARSAIIGTEIINENIIVTDENGHIVENKESTDKYFEEKKKLLKNIISKSENGKNNKVLYVIHDYNVSEDETFGAWDELGCDIILTSWNDWSKSGVETVSLKSSDLSDENDAAIRIFDYYYKETAAEARDKEWVKRLEETVNTEEETINELIELVDYHPLCIKVLAKQMSYLNGMEMDPSDMLAELKEQGIVRHIGEEVQNRKDDEAMEYGDAYHHLECIFGAVRTLGTLEEDEKEALRIMTLVPSEIGISMSRFADWSGMGRKGAILLQNLCNKGWVEYESNKVDLLDDGKVKSKGMFYLPMVSSEVLYRQEGMESNCKNSERFISKCRGKEEKLIFFKEYNQYKFQLQEIIKHIKKEKSINYSEMLFEYAIFMYEFRNNNIEMKIAIEYMERVLEILTKTYDNCYERVAKAYDGVGIMYYRIGEKEKGIEYIEKGLEKRREVLGENHEDTANSYGNLGRLLVELNERGKGIKYQEKALEIMRKVLGENHEDTARLYNNLGVSYIEQGENEKGIEYIKKGLKIRIEELGENHRDTAESYNNVGVLCYGMEDKEKSLEYEEKALEIWKKTLGENHEDTAKAYYNVGKSYEQMGDKEKGLEHQEKALEIIRKVLGENHEVTATLYNNVGVSYEKMGENKKGLEYQEKSVRRKP